MLRFMLLGSSVISHENFGMVILLTLGLYWGYMGVILRLHWEYIGFIWGLYPTHEKCHSQELRRVSFLLEKPENNSKDSDLLVVV